MTMIISGSDGLEFPDGSDQTSAFTGNAAAITSGTLNVARLPSSGINAASITTGVLAEANGGTGTTVGYNGFKNRIINGAMVIDQRNAGASVTQTTSVVYGVDRFFVQGSVTSKFTAQQSSTAPAGFTNSWLLTSSAATTVGSSDYYYFGQVIEGFNVADLGFGTANAATITVSFWARSSLTGTFSGAILNEANNRSYAFTFTINSANTFEYKTVTIAGDTSGTWLKTNGGGLLVRFALGAGSSFLQAAGSWGTGNVVGATGTTQLISTSGATFYITGVQLEKGSTATSFDYLPYTTELALCQRYCPVWNFPSSSSILGNTFVYSTGTAGPFILANPVAVRSPVTGITVSAVSQFSVSDGDSSTACNGLSLSTSSTLVTSIQWSTATNRTNFRPHTIFNNTAGAFIIGNGCEL